MVWTKKSSLVLGVMILSCLSACSVAGPRHSPLPSDGPTMLDIYNGAAHQSAQQDSRTENVRDRMPMRSAMEYQPGPIRQSAQTQIERRFARVPNPDMIMYVFPHLQNRHPVPGYVTMFPLYETTEYLLPGENADTGFAR